MEGSYPNGEKTLWEKGKLLVMSNFSFSHSVFKRLISQGRQKVSLCGNGLNGVKAGYLTIYFFYIYFFQNHPSLQSYMSYSLFGIE